MAINVKHIKTDIANIGEATRFVYESDKRLFFVRLAMITLQSILPLASLYLLKLLVDGVTNSIVHHSVSNTYVFALIWNPSPFFQVTYAPILLPTSLILLTVSSYNRLTLSLILYIENLLPLCSMNRMFALILSCFTCKYSLFAHNLPLLPQTFNSFSYLLLSLDFPCVYQVDDRKLLFP